MSMKKGMPPPHQKYLVKRDGHFFIATPCYGMHHPWWVAQGPDAELEPVEMKEGDEHISMDFVILGVG